jgi:hypothetical protein
MFVVIARALFGGILLVVIFWPRGEAGRSVP